MRLRRSLAATFSGVGLLAMTTGIAPAHADPVDLTCSISVSSPSWVSGGHLISAEGAYQCNERQLSISVIVCLEPYGTGIPVTPYCQGQFVTNGYRAEAGGEGPCFPGLWLATARGASSAGRPAVAVSTAHVITDCDPL
jgi:hypothetical protein